MNGLLFRRFFYYIQKDTVPPLSVVWLSVQ
jgi:hypothetical protein